MTHVTAERITNVPTVVQIILIFNRLRRSRSAVILFSLANIIAGVSPALLVIVYLLSLSPRQQHFPLDK